MMYYRRLDCFATSCPFPGQTGNDHCQMVERSGHLCIKGKPGVLQGTTKGSLAFPVPGKLMAPAAGVKKHMGLRF